MARQIGKLQIKGRIDEYSFYQDRLHGYLVRRTGGVTAKQYQTNPRFAAARDASSEFALVSGTGKLIREAFGSFLQLVKDGAMVNRLNKELVALKQLDNNHPRGERSPETRMADADANKWLRIFQFNEGVKTHEIMSGFSYRREPKPHASMKLLESVFPEGATHAGLMLIQTVIDFEKKSYQTNSSEMALIPIGNNEESSLIIDKTLSQEGIEITCLQVIFFQEKNGGFIPLKGKVHSMGIIEIGDYHPVGKVCSIKHRLSRRNVRLRPDIRYVSQKKRFNQKRTVLKNHPT
jgi:hypothetical protein